MESTEDLIAEDGYLVNLSWSCTTKFWNPLAIKCYMMSMLNLAEPDWISIHCNQQLLTQLVCIKDVILENSTFNPRDTFLQKKYTCDSNAILVYDRCYVFHWVSNISSPEYLNKYSAVDIMKFKHIFEAIALESKYLSAFVKNQIQC